MFITVLDAVPVAGLWLKYMTHESFTVRLRLPYGRYRLVIRFNSCIALAIYISTYGHRTRT